MIVAAHQPNYFPSLDFFYKMIRADVFVLADDVQFITNGRINRTRIKNAGGAQWLTVPVRTKGRGLQKIKDVEIVNEMNWRGKHWQTLRVNYTKAPYFEKYADSIGALYQQKWNSVVALNVAGVELVRKQLGIECELVLSSGLNLESTATGRLVEMTRKLGCERYLTLQSGRRFLDESLFAAAGLELVTLDFVHPAYHQQFGAFLSGLSILDLLFNEGDDARQIVSAGHGQSTS